MPDRRSKYIPTEIKNKLYDRAGGVCQCSSPRCDHLPGKCGKPLAIGEHPGISWDVAVPANASESDYEIVGVPMCPDCIQLHILSSDNESAGG